MFLPFFPKAGETNGWYADSFLRLYLGKRGMSLLSGVRDDDLFLLLDADELPTPEALTFLKEMFKQLSSKREAYFDSLLLVVFHRQASVSACCVNTSCQAYDGWTEPVKFGFRWTVFGFFWLKADDRGLLGRVPMLGNFLAPEKEKLLTLFAACTVGLLRQGGSQSTFVADYVVLLQFTVTTQCCCAGTSGSTLCWRAGWQTTPSAGRGPAAGSSVTARTTPAGTAAGATRPPGSGRSW